MEQNRNNLRLGESHLFQQSNLKVTKDYSALSPSPIQHVCLIALLTDVSVDYTHYIY